MDGQHYSHNSYIIALFFLLYDKKEWVGGFSSAQDCARLTLLCAKNRGFPYSSFPGFFTCELADLAPYESRISPNTFGINFPNNKRVYCIFLLLFFVLVCRRKVKQLERFIPKEWRDNEDWQEMFDLIRRMLELNPEKRITLADAMEHPFLKRAALRQNSRSSSGYVSR